MGAVESKGFRVEGLGVRILGLGFQGVAHWGWGFRLMCEILRAKATRIFTQKYLLKQTKMPTVI